MASASSDSGAPDSFTGFFGSLSPAQTAALEEVKQALCADCGGACPLNDHDCLRFLRARRFDISNSMAMLRAFLEWRKRENVDTILDRPESAQRKLIQVLCPMCVCVHIRILLAHQVCVCIYVCVCARLVRMGSVLSLVHPRYITGSSHHKVSKTNLPVFIQKYGCINVAAMHERGITDDDCRVAHTWDMEFLRRRCVGLMHIRGQDVYTYIHAYMHTHMHTYTHTCIHTYTHAYIHA
jgi:hypothetical protein